MQTPSGGINRKNLDVPTPKESPGSNEYNKAFQAQLANDISFLRLDEKSSPSTLSSQGQTPPGKKPHMVIPDIPPFRGVPGKGQPLAQPQTRTPSGAAAQQPLPSFSPKDFPFPSPVPSRVQGTAAMNNQQPLPPLTSKTNQAQPSASSTSSHSSQDTTPQAENLELTALSSVLIPALEAAMHRRTYMLKELARSSKLSPSAAAEIQQQRVQSHEKVRRLVAKTAGIFHEIQKCDEECPVGMGGGVMEFLEGFLEEILVRVEAAEDPMVSPGKA
jgi:serine/threonine-protein kinase 24/25/MST4